MADKNLSQLTALDSADLTNDDLLMLWNTSDGTTRRIGAQDILEKGRAFNAGYYALLTNFYFTGGVATVTTIDEDNIDTWIQPAFTTDAQGVFDYRPLDMTEAVADPFDDSTQIFSLEGLSLSSSVNFRASMSFDPDEDEGILEARLLFNRHSGTVPAEDFSIEDVALTMSNGAELDYPAEPLLTFFVGDTIDTNGPGDAGQCTFQVRSTVPGTVSMRALTWYISS